MKVDESSGMDRRECTGWCRETVKFEIIRKNEGNLKLYLILKMCSTRVEIPLGITF
jgi:predicted nucleic acid-binding Zn ribbon protein